MLLEPKPPGRAVLVSYRINHMQDGRLLVGRQVGEPCQRELGVFVATPAGLDEFRIGQVGVSHGGSRRRVLGQQM